MNIIIDTNTIKKNWIFRTEIAQAFLDFIGKTRSNIYVPRIVWEEVRRNYRQDLQSNLLKYIQSCKHLGGTLVKQPDFLHLNINNEFEVEHYMKWLAKSLDLNVDEQILEYAHGHLERVANRALDKRRPFNDKNEREFKDSIIWENVLDLVGAESDKGAEEIVFISSDGNAFAMVLDGGKKKLHPELQAEIDSVLFRKGSSSRFYYYSSLDEFVFAHYAPIKNISLESVGDYIMRENSAFWVVFSESIQKQSSDFVQAVQQANSDCYFPDIEKSLDDFSIVRASDVFLLHVYKYELTGKIVVFCQIKLQFLVLLNYYFTRTVGLKIIKRTNVLPTFHYQLSIQYENEALGDIKIEDVSLVLDNSLFLGESEESIRNYKSDKMAGMKFIVSSSALLKQLQNINGIVAHNPIVPILENFLFEVENEPQKFTLDISDKINTGATSLKIKRGSNRMPKKAKKRKR